VGVVRIDSVYKGENKPEISYDESPNHPGDKPVDQLRVVAEVEALVVSAHKAHKPVGNKDIPASSLGISVAETEELWGACRLAGRHVNQDGKLLSESYDGPEVPFNSI
jgi:hypothetical protein